MRDKIARQGDRIVIGEIELPVQQITYVDVVFRPPRRFLLFSFIGLALFLLTAVSMVGLAILTTLWGNTNSPTTSWALSLVFFTGGTLSFGTFIFAMIAYPVEWRVQVVTAQGTHIVYVHRSRTRAMTFANRIRRLLPNSEVPFG